MNYNDPKLILARFKDNLFNRLWGHGCTFETHWPDDKALWDALDDLLAELDQLRGNPSARQRAKALEKRIAGQKAHIEKMEQSNRELRVRLDAMHWVYCDGGCPGGVHRYNGPYGVPKHFDAGSEVELTEDVVRRAEVNTLRMRNWFENNKSWKRYYDDLKAKGDEERANAAESSD